MARFRRFEALLLLCLALTACGDSASSDAATKPVEAAAKTAAPRACDVLTSADAEKALGRAVQRLPNDGGPAGLDICQYGYQGERIADAGNVSVTLQPVDIASLRKGVVDAGGTPEPVVGLGDSAFWTADYGLYVGKGNRTAIYLLGAGGMADAKARSIELARATSGRF
ncbi:hypothetical protein E2493_19835 [Sphingomonas parva]|uniref:DUF3558 domain-containing protein n=1 Tax=Sphingomonas parva TaxID=2555898 RepID=A0A4Y8ZKH7_9SPHN|nr:hypothetical protein [Sphingomonas parva]TFI56503.1 hypothetical protein E2493_19835 [Sphingomonas parva]